jgi:hypothetical protein
MSTTIPLSPEQRAARTGTLIKWIAFAVLGLAFSFIAQAVITGMLGLVVAASIAGGVYWALPLVEQKATNLKLKLIKREAANNPIETLENEFMRRNIALSDAEHKVETFDASCQSFADKVDQFKRQWPDQAPKFVAILGKMQQVLARQTQLLVASKHSLNLFEKEIEKAKAIWDMVQAAAVLNKSAGLSQDEFYAKLKTDTALDSITDGMNTTFAQLNTSLIDGDTAAAEINVTPAAAALPAASGAVIDVDATEPEAVPAIKRRART